jgi:hypothetical protein
MMSQASILGLSFLPKTRRPPFTLILGCLTPLIRISSHIYRTPYNVKRLKANYPRVALAISKDNPLM